MKLFIFNLHAFLHDSGEDKGKKSSGFFPVNLAATYDFFLCQCQNGRKIGIKLRRERSKSLEKPQTAIGNEKFKFIKRKNGINLYNHCIFFYSQAVF